MKIIVTGKNIAISDKIQDAIDKRFEKLGKFFADDIQAKVLIHPEKSKVKVEATIFTKGTIFRAEEVSQDVYDCIDAAAEKLMSQMSKYKGKLMKKYKGKESIKFEMIPEAPGLEEEIRDALMQALGQLTEPDREILLRRYYFDQKPKEIAKATGLTVKQVENHLYRTKRRLRETLTEVQDEI